MKLHGMFLVLRFKQFTPQSNHLQLVRYLNTTCPCFKYKPPERRSFIPFSKKFVKKEDLDKRPSDLEIKKKDLPVNTPTLGERVKRDGQHLFHQNDRKHGYYSDPAKANSNDNELIALLKDVKKDVQKNPKEALVRNFKIVANEVKKWGEETKTGLSWKNTIDKFPRQGDRRTEWEFKKEEDLSQWVLTVDSDWGEGYSTADLEYNPAGHAVFRGHLSTRVPADGRTQAAGYANIGTVNRRKSFARLKMLPWMYYTHLYMNVRGDGRTYMLNLNIQRDFDITWDDRYHYPLFTRGGPYWQYVKIPFGKFYFGNKGKIQDRQNRIMLELSTGMSITLADNITGPFQLEVKDIGVQLDMDNDPEWFAYEKYKVPAWYAGE